MGISEQPFYRWKKKHGGLGTGELRRLEMLEEENRKLNHKRVYRLYKEEGLLLRSKRPKRIVSAVHREETKSATRPDEGHRDEDRQNDAL